MDWPNTDWSLTTAEIARQKGVHPATVTRWRNRLAPDTLYLKKTGANDGLRAKSVPSEDHHNGRRYLLTAPDNARYEVKNLADFVRKNTDLFDPEDVTWIARKGKVTPDRCRAIDGFRSVLKGTTEYWKGWHARRL